MGDVYVISVIEQILSVRGVEEFQLREQNTLLVTFRNVHFVLFHFTLSPPLSLSLSSLFPLERLKLQLVLLLFSVRII